MSTIRLIDRIAQGKATRREIQALAVAAGVTTVTMPVIRRPAMAVEGSDLLYFTWGGFEDPSLFPAFAEKWGEPSVTFYGDEYEAIEKLRAGYEADVICPCIDVMPNWVRVGLQPIDESRLLYLGDTFESIRSPEAAFEKGARVYVPTYYGFSSFVYRTDLTDITPETESWQVFFDETYKGRLAIWDSSDAVIPVASLAAGDLEDPYRPDGDRLVAVEALLRKQRDLVRFYWNEQTTSMEAIISGEIVASYAWSSAIPHLIESGVPFKWATPKEGLISYVCGLARANRPGTDEELVYDFINASMSPEAGAFMIEAYALGAANKDSYDLVDHEVLVRNGLETPEESLAGSHTYQFVPVDLKQKHIAIFDEIRAGF
ncbi:MAG: extracellular solute-binding protein [Proteobacteria bacterium]|nr:extracellular solute-binding protein [Pseudomonadota bacterium]MDA1069969.1 extracellular solute-binding protein [Pseudomonadota bacterium]